MQKLIFEYNKEKALLSNKKRFIVEVVLLGFSVIIALGLNQYMGNYLFYFLIICTVIWFGLIIDRFMNRKKVITNTYLQLSDHELTIKDNSSSTDDVVLNYNSLEIFKIKFDGDQIKSILVKYQGSNALLLKDFHKMDDLYTILSSNIPVNHV